MNFVLAADSPLDHVLDKKHSKSIWHLFDQPGDSEVRTEVSNIGEIGDLTVQTLAMIVGTAFLIWLMFRVAKRIRTGPETEGNERYITKGRVAQLLEVILVYLRDQLIQPVLGEKHTRRYLPFLMTLFFFILTINLIGMLPLLDLQNLIGAAIWGTEKGGQNFAIIGGTATSNVSVTAMLALVSFVVIQIHSFRELGFVGWLDHLTCGLMKGPKGLWLVVPIIFAVEIAGVIIKPAALAIRLFANMLGGHILLATLLLLPTMLQKQMGFGTGGLMAFSVVSGGFAVIITFLELFVAFLQAFIFMFLTAVFISLMSHEEHEHEEHAEQEVVDDLEGGAMAHGSPLSIHPRHDRTCRDTTRITTRRTNASLFGDSGTNEQVLSHVRHGPSRHVPPG